MINLWMYFHICDLFGTNFNFTNFKLKKFHTFFGLFLSFVVYVLVCTFIGVFGADMFNRTNPKVLYQQVLPKTYPQFIPNTKNFTFAWTLEDDLGYWNMTNKLYSRTIYRKMVQDKEGTLQIVSETYLNQTLCSSLKVDEKFTNMFNPEHWYCLDFKEQNVTIGGFWGEEFLDLLSVEIYVCPDNNSSHPNCTTIEDLKEYTLTRKLYFCTVTPEFYFDVANLGSPLGYHYVEEYNQMSINIIRTDNLYLKQVEALDDQNLIRTEFVEHSQLVKNKIIPMLTFKETKDYSNKNLATDLYTTYIYLSKEKDKYTRTFMKLQDLAALVGGFMTIVLTIGKSICSYYNNYQRYINLINELFIYEDTGSTFHEDKDKSPESNLIPSSLCNSVLNMKTHEMEITPNIVFIGKKVKENITGLSDFANSVKPSNNAFNEASLLEGRKTNLSILSEPREKELIQKIKDNHKKIQSKKKENWFSLGSCLFIKRYMCRKALTESQHQKVKIYDFAIEYIVDKLDITNYIYTIQTLERMKIFSYNDSQVIGLDYCRNPNLNDINELKELDIKPEKYHLDGTKDKETQGEIGLYDQNQQLQLIKYFINKLKTNSLDDKDLKIYQILEKGLKTLIQEELNL